ncbi:MAG: NAD(P)(+) transhydrogenase (Re/Si-specific) subunit beta [bacterium]|nr:NAD(P)(+) transhydrogenase (Re/Si-specific) subunit beta [bacterium]
MIDVIRELGYLISAFLFILGIKYMGNPVTAIRGNIVSFVGMIIAVVFTFFHSTVSLGNLGFILLAIILGSFVGVYLAQAVKFTEMPQMVSFFNGMGGLTIALISVVEFFHKSNLDKFFIISAGFSGAIGSVSFVGSMLAMAKLWGMFEKSKKSMAIRIFNLGLIISIFLVFVILILKPSPWLLIMLFILGGTLGFSGVFPIGGADMPVVIALLNAFTGLAASVAGFAIDNNAMIVSGTLVGASGTILTILMAKAMNRTVWGVIVGGFGGVDQTSKFEKGNIQEIGVQDAAILLRYSKKVVIVPGYGMAVSNAQNEVHEIEELLEKKGVEVKYAIHPVAGRMPGHMNVLLAEAKVDYSKLYEMEKINPEFKTTDVVLVVGANDIVNPAAKNNPNSPLYGMPILEVDQAQNIIFMKRSLRPGFAGVDNELFFDSKTRMLFGDAKETLKKLISEIKNL